MDLYVANADGSSPTLLTTAGASGSSLSSVAISPDGTQIAFADRSGLAAVAVTSRRQRRVDRGQAGRTAAVSPDRPEKSMRYAHAHGEE